MYEDIKGHWAEKYIKFVIGKGIMKVDEKGNFNPDSPLTRGEMAVILARLDAEKKVITPIKGVIDPGHGGKDRRNRGPNGYIEADGVLKISKYLEEELESTGHFEIELTRCEDKTLSHEERTQVAVNFEADFIISEHTNASKNNVARGTSCYYSVNRPMDKTFAQYLCEEISILFNTPNRGAKIRSYRSNIKIDYYGMIRRPVTKNIPHALIIESLFHDNIEDEKLLLDDNNLKLIAKAQAIAIRKFYGIEVNDVRF